MQVKALYQSVTNDIIKQLEEGTPVWIKPWKCGARGGLLPFNAASNRSYSGINIPILWAAAHARGYPTHGWLTYKQAQAAGAQVLAGEKSTTVVFTKKLMLKDDEDVEKQIGMLRTFNVFNEWQMEGLPKAVLEAPPPLPLLQDNAQAFINATGAYIRHGGDRAYYQQNGDLISLPTVESFESRAHYLATALHECCHWTGAKHRLDRDMTGRFRTKAYAAEELVAELGAAFLCAHLNIEGELRHADYIASWIQLLKEDDRAIFTAASKASQAADFLRAFSEKVAEAA
ncbi:MAG: ArdC family protein [Pseudolabrys sp.]